LRAGNLGLTQTLTSFTGKSSLRGEGKREGREEDLRVEGKASRSPEKTNFDGGGDFGEARARAKTTARGERRYCPKVNPRAQVKCALRGVTGRT